ncbi:hypothetical protein K502DRAFT_368886 [Neoconidiobolus thromboides FSU 785]|nr:hypothetical protein K502DRAFT_368886 [Neoconidiobolus thromboides FSU 785]
MEVTNTQGTKDNNNLSNSKHYIEAEDLLSSGKHSNTNEIEEIIHEDDKLPNQYTKNGYGGATIMSSITNLSNTILGSGMLAMPAAFATVGLNFGIFLVLFSGFTSGSGLYLLSQCAQRVNHRNSSFFEVSKLTYPSAAKWFNIAIAIKCFGVSISYLIIIGDLMPQIMESMGFLDSTIFLNRRFWITFFMLGIIPLGFLKKLDSLRYTSIIALGSVLYLVLIVTFTFLFGNITIDWNNIRYFQLNWNFLQVLPVFVFGFTCHQNLFSIYNELSENSNNNLNKVIQGSISAGLLVYQVIGILGYLSFGNDVKSNILSMYELGPIITLGRFAVVILALFSYPLQCHPCRACLIKVIGITSNKSTETVDNNNQDSNYVIVATEENSEEIKVIESINNEEEWYFNIITIILISASYLIAILVTKLDVILGFVGSTGSTAISFILPGIFYLKITQNQPENVFDQNSNNSVLSLSFKRSLAYFLTIYGFLVMSVCFTYKVYKLFV